MSTSSEEAPFLSGMEREPVCDTTVLKFKVDGLEHKVETIKERISDAVEAATKAAKAAMGRPDDRGPDPDVPDEERILVSVRTLEQLLNNGGYKEAPKNDGGGGSFQKSVLGICGALTIAGILGGIAMFGRLAGIEEKVLALKEQVADLRTLVRYQRP